MYLLASKRLWYTTFLRCFSHNDFGKIPIIRFEDLLSNYHKKHLRTKIITLEPAIIICVVCYLISGHLITEEVLQNILSPKNV